MVPMVMGYMAYMYMAVYMVPLVPPAHIQDFPALIHSMAILRIPIERLPPPIFLRSSIRTNGSVTVTLDILSDSGSDVLPAPRGLRSVFGCMTTSASLLGFLP